ncbi:hypothetical protein G6F57_007210 [Rhizopus arrhizus]|uniref:C2 NT-type domain-containing protein n=1 Tax=Rhizopus oryzae TaxID=64495 RepID=A0A9P7BMM3_RHIOR|nr:hypothetical protein G6F23_010695 [Rhizopus arrhizus]KAG1408289.1 hypothetical protein G6F58_009512 [Rhizopus delemar]KAG0755911.1 hypothetical protein G6F24_011513 [Rhizopus arrhizus]KAG0788246.1 hypothetical protein G6F22_007063 [Rhizopus arrhizus]KAG0790605.1 hypothetical protein G6F21_005686 [Rhizopus arrhizus]
MQFSNLFVSKHRKLDFSIQITIHDLANVPLVSGLYHVKWKLKNASHASGSTMSSPIRDHVIVWSHPINSLAHLVIAKDNILGPCEFKLQVFQEIGGTKDIVFIGSLTINLSEYANTGLTSRRYLLDECKFNSTIKLSFRLDQVTESAVPYNIPPLKKQQMFTDIPTMIINDRQQLDPTSSNSSQEIKRSHSSSALPQYCRQVTPFHNTDDPSPTDLVEQLFKTTQ